MKLKTCSPLLSLAAAGLVVPVVSHAGAAQQPSAGAKPSELPAGQGREPFIRICTGCHAASVSTAEHRSAESWANVVDDMRGRGAIGSDDDMDKITAWLAVNFPAKATEQVEPGPKTGPTEQSKQTNGKQ